MATAAVDTAVRTVLPFSGLADAVDEYDLGGHRPFQDGLHRLAEESGEKRESEALHEHGINSAGSRVSEFRATVYDSLHQVRAF